MVWSRITMLSVSSSLPELDFASIWMSNDDDVIVDKHRRDDNVDKRKNAIINSDDR